MTSMSSRTGRCLLGLVAALTAVPLHAQANSGCEGQAHCAFVREFTATVTNFRPSTVDAATRAIAITVRFQNRTAKPLVLGYVVESGVITDDRGNRYLVAPGSVRGIGQVSAREFDPKFVLAPGEASDARLELVLRRSANQIWGTAFELDLAIREIDPIPGNQFTLGKEHVLHFAGLGPAAMAGADAAPPAPEPAPAPAPAEEVDHCAGKARCYGAGPFTVEAVRVTPSQGGRHHVVELTLRFRNVVDQALILGYTGGSSTAVDEHGNRYYWGRASTHDVSAKGIGVVTGRQANAQFALRPGQSRDATFTLIRYNARAPLGTAFTWNAVFVELEVLGSNQVRTVREFSVGFEDLKQGAASGAKKVLDALIKPKS